MVVVFGPYVTDRDTLLGCKAVFVGVVGVEDVKRSEQLAASLEGWESVNHMLPEALETGSSLLLRVPRVTLKVVNALALGGWETSPPPLALDLPADGELRASHGSVACVLGNVVDGVYTHVLSPLMVALTPPGKPRPSRKAFLLLIGAIQVAHSLGPAGVWDQTPPSGVTPVEAPLGSVHTVLDSIKAWLLGLYLAQSLGTSDERVSWQVLAATAVGDLVRRSRMESAGLLAEPEISALHAILGWMFTLGGLSVVRGVASSDLYVDVDAPLLAKRMSQGVASVVAHIGSGDPESALDWIVMLEDMYAARVGEWDAVVSRVDVVPTVTVVPGV